MKKMLVLLAVVGVLAPASADAQGGRPGRRGAGLEDPAVSPAEIQRMFDAYALMQAQEQLEIGDDQFSQFLTRYKALQDVRRKSLQERARLVNDLRRLLNDAQTEDAPIGERLKSLRELDSRSAAGTRNAYDAIDQILDLRQQAKFRVFEELMERRKLELVTRARQGNRPKQQ